LLYLFYFTGKNLTPLARRNLVLVTKILQVTIKQEQNIKKQRTKIKQTKTKQGPNTKIKHAYNKTQKQT
jgi:hypothetical protein